jgi:hypothetical protein
MRRTHRCFIPTSIRASTILAPLLLAAMLTSCAITSARLAMPEGFAPEDGGYAVDGHRVRYAGKPVRFGPYAATGVTGSGLPMTWTLTGPLFGLGVGKESRRYAFEFAAPRTTGIQIRCQSSEWFVSLRRDRFSAQIPTSTEKPVLGCDIVSAAADIEPMPMRLWARGNDIFGSLRMGDIAYEVESLRGIEGVRMEIGEPTGYRFSRAGRILAVVDVLDAGRVYFAAGIEVAERDRLAAAAAALLMLG